MRCNAIHKGIALLILCVISKLRCLELNYNSYNSRLIKLFELEPNNSRNWLEKGQVEIKPTASGMPL